MCKRQQGARRKPVAAGRENSAFPSLSSFAAVETGFTLIELLVVMGITAILAAMRMTTRTASTAGSSP
jgi:prepilin-type N-terminal cleavage/methylation domain-containing protein